MRALILTAGAALTLTLGACNSNEQAGNTVNVDEILSTEKLVANDITAIDAVTGADANMAADVNFIHEATNGADDDGSGPRETKPAAKASGSNTAQPRPKAAPDAEPAANSTAEAAANNAT